VVATAVSVRRSAEGGRKIQSGFVRHYALVVVVGMMLVVLFLVARSW